MNRSLDVFCSYASQDEKYRDELVKYLANSPITLWYDHKITEEKNWETEIDPHLNNAHLILILISVDLMVSDYCYGIEMQVALEKHATKQAIVIPIIVRPVDWEDAPFSHLPVLPTHGNAISSWENSNQAFQDVADGIWQIIHNRENTELYLNKGDILFQSEDFQGALAAYEKALGFDSNNISLYEKKGDTLFKLGSFKDALAAYDQAIQCHPTHIKRMQLQNKQSAIYAAIGRTHLANIIKGNNLYLLEKALEAYNKAIQLDAHNPILHKEKGDVLFHLNRWNDALASYEEAIRLKPDFGPAYLQKSKVLQAYAQYTQQEYERFKNLAEQSKKVNELREKPL